MGFWSIIAMVIQLIRLIPQIISIGTDIIKLLPKFKDADFLEVLRLIAEIIGLILGLAKTDQAAAKSYASSLRDEMRHNYATAAGHKDRLTSLKDRIKRHRKDGIGMPPSTVMG